MPVRPQSLVLPEPPRERAHHALDRDQVADGRLLQALLAAQRDGGLAIHQPTPATCVRSDETTNGTLESTTFGSNRNKRFTNSAFWLQEPVPPPRDDELGQHDDHERPGARGEPPDLLERRPGQVAERRLDDVERDPTASAHSSCIRWAASGSRSK